MAMLTIETMIWWHCVRGFDLQRRNELAIQQPAISRLSTHSFPAVLGYAAQTACATTFGGKLHFLHVVEAGLRPAHLGLDAG